MASKKEKRVPCDIRIRRLPESRAKYVQQQAELHDRKLPQQLEHMLKLGAKANLWP